ncbi:MAG: cadherin-like beta sandwich domain-containing protein [Muribaculaceae bacterium]|nr:cadherin-like beta sandwich domain-containing protein [Roseburia sp.]MCM1431780.1 cadherin-like beta sandwich domain-containing protein [Muribaculaceae bacterium]MCM1493354.1 cadherin-like beta sandwich domain-containing protein [Muribaculaceae bacterium]
MNRIQRNIHRSGSAMALFFMLVLFAGILVPESEVRADSLSLSVSASSVKIGDSVTVSITVPAGVSATVNVTYPNDLFSFTSASETANANGGTVSMTLGGYGGTDTKTTGTMKFKAKAAGSATFSVSAPVAGNQEGDQVTLGGASASVRVKNEAGSNNSGGSTNNKPDEKDDKEQDGEESGGSKSADNSLSSLTLSEGKLSPAFQYNVVNYTATVDYSVTSVVVSAKTSNARATITSVEGGENLKVGENRIQIVVKAENGVTATYTITVTRKAEGEGGAEDAPEEETPEPEGEPCYVVNSQNLYPAQEIPQEAVPEGFSPSEISLWDNTYPCLVDSFAGGILRLVYLTQEDGGQGKLYLLGNSPYEAYDYVCLHSEAGFVIVLPEGDENAPAGYTMGTCRLAELGTIDAWFPAEAGRVLFYGVSQSGAEGWYELDTEELTYMRYIAQEPQQNPAETAEPSTESVAAPEEDNGELARLKTQNTWILGIGAIVIILLLIVIAVLAFRRRGGVKEEDEDLEFIDL